MSKPDPHFEKDKNFLLSSIDRALLSGGLTIGFASASEARSARRRMYYVAQQLVVFDRQKVNQVEFKLTGRMIAIIPKKTLSSLITSEEKANANRP